MPLFGAHMSVAGGCHKALLIAQTFECDTVQLFTKNANQWKAKEFTDLEVQQFRDTLAASSLRFPMAHDSYLINLASPDEQLYQRSIDAFVIEMQRAEQLGLAYLVTHPGAHVGSGEEAGLERVVAGIDEAHRRCPGFRLQVLLETTAGQGSCLGWRFEHLAHILKGVRESDRLGICLDTCHVFAAGYEMAPVSRYRATMKEFDRLIGLERLRACHLNDSVKPLGSRVDRHAHVGHGQLGIEPFRLLVNDRRLRDLPMVLETPKEETPEGHTDARNLRTLRDLATKVAKTGRKPKI
ncbi:MAG TPA: deoxyribonuclease IV [Gemmataceae bacterium]|nr:deoxyribonuclease IV [Gemmataceae bacterium]